MANETRWSQYRHDLLEQVDFVDAYQSFGLEITKILPDSKGWIPAKSHEKFGGQDNHPSAAINVLNGIYKDFRANKSVGIFDFMVAVEIVPNWREAQKYLAERYKFKMPNMSKNHPEYGVEWQTWTDSLAEKFCKVKSPITIEGLKVSGAQMCVWHGQPAFCWCIYDDNLHITGYYYTPRSGGLFEKPTAKSIAKTFPGAEAGFVGLPAVQAMLSDRHPDRQKQIATLGKPGGEQYRALLWVEGVPDLIAAYSLFPKSTEFVTNPHGCSENVTFTQIKMLHYSPVRLGFIADCDIPGVLGAHKKSRQLQVMWADRVGGSYGGTVYCPYPDTEIQSKNGKDLRDFLIENITDLKKIKCGTIGPQMKIGGIELFSIEDPEQVKKLQQASNEQTTKQNQKLDKEIIDILDQLQIKILMVYEDSSFVIGCAETQRTKHIHNLKSFYYADLLLVGGKRSHRLVSETDEREPGQIIKFKDFVKVLSLAVSSIASCDTEIIGEGLWRVNDISDSDSYRVTAVKRGTFYFADHGGLEVQAGPNYGNYIADYEDKDDWFEHGLLNHHLNDALSEEWRLSVHQEFRKYVSSWAWSYEDMDLVACGLFYSTWLQTIWKWRPIVTLTGESESGKTYFLEFLSELFLGSTSPLGSSTTAGVLQTIKNRATPILLDEFDTASEQKKLFHAFRACGRGQSLAKGTANQSGKIYRLKHIPWLSGIYFATDEQADLNRMIQLHLLTNHGARSIIRPDSITTWELGHKILACMLTIAEDARQFSIDLIKVGKRSRYRESYSVPFATLGLMAGETVDSINVLLEDYLENFVTKEINIQDARTDQEAALFDIMSAVVRLPTDAPIQEPTVAMMLTNSDYFSYWDYLEPKGLGVKEIKNTGHKYLAIHSKQLVSENGLLGKTHWRNNPGISQVLRRLDTALKPTTAAVYLSGNTRNCLRIPFDNLIKWLKEKTIKTDL